MLGISHLLESPTGKQEKQNTLRRKGKYGVKWVARRLAQSFLREVWLGCEGRGQQEANRQTVLLHPDGSEDARGSSLSVLTTFYFEKRFSFFFYLEYTIVLISYFETFTGLLFLSWSWNMNS